MKISFSSYIALIFGLALSLAAVLPFNQAVAAESIKGTYTFEGKAKAKGPGGKSTKNFKGKMRVGINSVRLQIPISKNGRVVPCNKMVRAKLNRKLKRNPARASRRAKFFNVPCEGVNWTGTLRLKWLEHPEGYAVAFSIGGINDDDLNVQTVTGKFKGSTGTLSTAENQPEVPEVPDPE